MLKNITDFSHKRNPSEATVFYLFYLVVGLVFSSIVTGLITSFVTNNTKELFSLISTIVMAIFVFNLSFLILKEKKMLGNSKYAMLVSVATLLAYLGSGFLGLIISAYLTTQGGLEEKTFASDIPVPSL